MDIITREEWNARAPRSVEHTDWNHRRLFVVHYSGANPDQTVRAIQDYHMDTRGWSDIGYNWIVDKLGRIYEGRGWLTIGAHAKGFNTAGIGVCVIGLDHPHVIDATPAVKHAVRWLYDEANSRRHKYTGQADPLVIRGHRDIGETDCPGDELYAWVRTGLQVFTPPAPAPAPSTLEATVQKMPTLKLGSKGFAVELIQRLVNHLDHAGLTTDGDYGPKTEAAVRKFESSHKIPKSVRPDGTGDGEWGPECWAYALRQVR